MSAGKHRESAAMHGGHGWRRQLINAAGMWCVYFVAACAYGASLTPLFRKWNDWTGQTYAHGWLIAATSLWLMYDSADSARQLRMRPSVKGMVIVALTSVTWLFAAVMQIQIAQQLFLPVIVLAWLYSLFGVDVMRSQCFAVCYLYFAIPFWNVFNPVLQWISVITTRIVLRALGIPAYFEGNFIYLPDGALVIEGGCSGLNYLIVGVALAALFGHLRGVRHRGRLIALAIALAMLANWIRIAVIAVAGYLTHMQHYLVRVEHVRFGWVVFAAAMLAFVALARRLDVDDAFVAPAETPQAGVSTSVVAPWLALAVVMAGLLGPAWHMVITLRPAAPLGDASALDNAHVDWRAVAPPPSEWVPVFVGADSANIVRFQHKNRFVDVFEARYARQTQDRKLAGYFNSVLGASLYEAADLSVPSAPEGFSQLAARDASRSVWLVRYRFFVESRAFSSARAAQIYYGLRSLIGNAVSGVAVWRVQCAVDCVSENELLNQFSLTR